MNTETEVTLPTSMLDQVRQTNDEARTTVRTGEGGSAEETEVTAAPGEAAANGEVTAEAASGEEEESIKIGDKLFKTQKEAIEYAEQITRERDMAEAHAMGIREALEATRVAQAPPPVVEENFEEKFYADPKTALKELKASAVSEAAEIIRREKRIEDEWSSFIEANPDLDRRDAERILAENWDTIGKMTDLPRARSLLAQKTRAYYQGIIERMKPRTQLTGKGGQVVSSGTPPSKKGVTPASQEKPLDFVSQLKRMKSNA